jgi:hypothetical protein
LKDYEEEANLKRRIRWNLPQTKDKEILKSPLGAFMKGSALSNCDSAIDLVNP